jgi:hypothetical protein
MSATATIPNLWPESFDTVKQPSPAAILRQQGDYLGQKTNHYVYGEVTTTRHNPQELFHHFRIRAPRLDVEQVAVFVKHDFSMYPAELCLLDVDGQQLRSVTARNSDEFIAQLRTYLSAPHWKAFIESLIAQVDELDLAVSA